MVCTLHTTLCIQFTSNEIQAAEYKQLRLESQTTKVGLVSNDNVMRGLPDAEDFCTGSRVCSSKAPMSLWLVACDSDISGMHILNHY